MIVARRVLDSCSKRTVRESLRVVQNPFKLYKLDQGPENKCEVSKEELLQHYENMVYWRRLEIVADTLYKQRLIRGFCHLYDGQVVTM